MKKTKLFLAAVALVGLGAFCSVQNATQDVSASPIKIDVPYGDEFSLLEVREDGSHVLLEERTGYIWQCYYDSDSSSLGLMSDSDGTTMTLDEYLSQK